MIVECPSCGVRGNYNKERVDVLNCKRCGTVFSPSESDLPDHGVSERVWRVKGETGPPVSLRVLRYRLKTGSLKPEQLISADGEEWISAASHPVIMNATGEFSPPPQKEESLQAEKLPSAGETGERSGDDFSSTSSPMASGETVPGDETGEEAALQPPGAIGVDETPPPATETTQVIRKSSAAKRLKRAVVAFSFASFAVGASAAFFFPLSDTLDGLKVKNERLAEKNLTLNRELTGAKTRIEELENRLMKLDDEFERVRSSSEEFLQAKSILEDIKASIDSRKIYLVISLAENRLYVKIGTKTLKKYTVSTGKGRTILKTTGKPYNFLTPRGKMVIEEKERNPVWFKPDWAWLEAGEPLPANISIQERVVKGALGKYRLKLGAGYAIHGTESGEVNGKRETHGCIRVARKDLTELYTMVRPGTEVYVY